MWLELISGVVLLVAGGFCYLVFILYNEIEKYKHIAGPEAKGILGFFLGNLPSFKELNAKGVMFSEIFHRLFKEYNSKTIKYRLMNHTMVFTMDPRVIKEVLIDQDCIKYPRSYNTMGFPGGYRFLGNGLLTEIDSEKWKKRRTLFNPAFHKQCLRTFMKAFNTKAVILIEHLKHLSETQKESITLLDHFNHTALDIIAHVAFSMDVDTIRDPNNVFNKYVTDSLVGACEHFFDPFMKFKPNKWSYVREHREKIKYLRDFGRKQIETRLEAIKKGESVPNDLLTVILQTMVNSGSDEFYIEDMVDDFLTFFVAGQETTSGALASTFLELGRRPDIVEKLKKEIDAEIGTKPEIDFEDFHKLRYTKAVFKETLRLYPPSADPAVRLNQKDIKIDEVFIPKGTMILCSMYSSGRCEDNFKDCYTYKPERFLKENEDVDIIQNYTYYPFALGPRTCIGQNFAQIEAMTIIAKMIQNFDVRADPNQSDSLSHFGSTRPKDGAKCYLTWRH